MTFFCPAFTKRFFFASHALKKNRGKKKGKKIKSNKIKIKDKVLQRYLRIVNAEEMKERHVGRNTKLVGNPA